MIEKKGTPIRNMLAGELSYTAGTLYAIASKIIEDIIKHDGHKIKK